MVDQVLAKSFEHIGEDYDRYRPGFPRRAVEIVAPDRVRMALDLGAGTGKFTSLLTERADHVIAVEPSESMLAVLRQKLPGVDALLAGAERIPVDDSSVDLVTAAQAFHWFDREKACAEIARVLVPGGHLGLVWNHSDPASTWDRAAHRIAHPAVAEADDTTSSAAEELPGLQFVSRERIPWAERVTRADYLRRWSTVSTFLVAGEEARAEKLAAIGSVLDSDPETHGRDEFELPIVTDVFVYRRA